VVLIAVFALSWWSLVLRSPLAEHQIRSLRRRPRFTPTTDLCRPSSARRRWGASLLFLLIIPRRRRFFALIAPSIPWEPGVLRNGAPRRCSPSSTSTRHGTVSSSNRPRWPWPV
jgi:hypothetical protein